MSQLFSFTMADYEASFARTKGAKDKKERKKRGVGRALGIAGGLGALGTAGAAGVRYGGAEIAGRKGGKWLGFIPTKGQAGGAKRQFEKDKEAVGKKYKEVKDKAGEYYEAGKKKAGEIYGSAKTKAGEYYGKGKAGAAKLGGLAMKHKGKTAAGLAALGGLGYLGAKALGKRNERKRKERGSLKGRLSRLMGRK